MWVDIRRLREENHVSVATPAPTPSVTPVGSVPDGKVADFLTGKFVNDTPEEYVRQNIEKALVRQYKYAPADCVPEFAIKVGSARKRVDIVVFGKGADHTQANAHILIETKRADVKPTHRTEGVGQLQSYMASCLNAQYGMWTNGTDRFCFAKRSDGKGGWTFEEIIDVPGFGQTEADAQRPSRKDLKVATADNLLFAFRRCHNYIAAHEGKQKTEAFWELLKLIFTKIEDERAPKLNFFATPSERGSSTVASAAKKRIQALFEQRVVKKYPMIFEAKDADIDLKPEVVAYVVTELQGYSLLRSPVDVKGVAYEEIVGSNLRGDRGEFFTPRNACRMAVAMLDPRPGERILDPSCGTGGFLITGMNHALEYIERTEREQWDNPAQGTDLERDELYRRRDEYFRQCVLGIDLNPALVRAAKMNMVMNNDGSGGLSRPTLWRIPTSGPGACARPCSWARSTSSCPIRRSARRSRSTMRASSPSTTWRPCGTSTTTAPGRSGSTSTATGFCRSPSRRRSSSLSARCSCSSPVPAGWRWSSRTASSIIRARPTSATGS
jgi:type I restriction enzyme M protein